MDSNNIKWPYIAYGTAWIATAIAVSVGIWLTGNGWCLLAFLIPGAISITPSKK